MTPDGGTGAGTPADELVAAVTQRLAGTAYVVERTEDGFVVRADLTRLHAHRPARERRTRTLVRHLVVLDERLLVLTITDEHVEVGQRGAGVRVARSRGRIREVSWSRTWDPRRPAGERVVDERRFDSHEVLRHVRDVATNLGWEERAGTAERVGRIAGVVGVVGAGAAVVGLALALLLGRL